MVELNEITIILDKAIITAAKSFIVEALGGKKVKHFLKK
jgi:hypothetical protein